MRSKKKLDAPKAVEQRVGMEARMVEEMCFKYADMHRDDS